MITHKEFLMALPVQQRRSIASTPTEGYDVYLVRDGQTPDFASPTLQVGVVDGASLTVADPGPNGTLWEVYVRARKAGLAGPAAEIHIRLVSHAGTLVQRPNRPWISQLVELADGEVGVSWEHNDFDDAEPAAGFRVYASNSPELSFVTPAATAGQWDRKVTLSGLEAGRPWWITVRAVSAAGHEDGNREARIVVPRNDPPPGLVAGALLVEQV